MSALAGEVYRFQQEIVFDGHIYGSTANAFPRGGECQIVRGTDGFYWNGTGFAAPAVWNATTIEASGQSHYYQWTIPGTASNGDVFSLRIRIKDDPETETTGHIEVRPTSGGGIIKRSIMIVDEG